MNDHVQKYIYNYYMKTKQASFWRILESKIDTN